MILIFDLDGTLADTIDDLARACNEVLTKVNLPPRPVSDYVKLIGGGRKKLMCDIAPEYAKDHLDEMIEEFSKYYNVHFMDHTQRYDGLSEMLVQLKPLGYTLAVLSNKPHEMTVPIVNALYPGLFDLIYGQLPNMPTKPSPDAVKMICAQLNMPMTKLLFIGDSDVDIQTAHNIGCPGIAVSWGYREVATLKQANPAAIVNTAQELFEAILSLS